jgi:hypothetical protein
VTDGGGEVKIAAPLWALGLPALLIGLVTHRKLLMFAGTVAIAADHDDEPVQRGLELGGKQ